MKKSILKTAALLLCVTIYSCSDSNHDPNNYVDNRLIEGTWYSILAKDSIIYTFQNNQAAEESYAHILGMDELKYEGKTNYGNYLLTDSLVILTEHTNFKWVYRLANNNDSLYIRDTVSKPTLWMGFKRQK